MSRATLILARPEHRERARHWIDRAPPGTRLEFKAPKRTLDQNAKMWAMLTDFARQVEHYGQKYTPDNWKDIFMAALNREVRMAPSLDGRGIVNIGRSTSDLSVAEMSDLIELIAAEGAQRGVEFSECGQ